MHDKRIKDELDRILGSARNLLAQEAMEWAGLAPRRDRKSKIEDLTPGLRMALSEHPIFSRYRERFFGAKQLMLDANWELPESTLRVAVMRSTDAAISWLQKIYAIEKTSLRLVVEIHGLRVDSEVTLPHGITFAPLSELPYSRNAAALIRHYQVQFSNPMGSTLSMPIVALLELPDVAGVPNPTNSKPHTDLRFEEIIRCAKAFTLAKEYAPIVGSSWIDFVDEDLSMTEIGRVWKGASYEGVLTGRALPELGADDLAWVGKYDQLKPGLRAICDIAIDRLNLARRRTKPGDKAIEAAICLEALLGDDDPKELTYKLALRTALLLGDSLEDRRAIKRDVGRLYQLRSRTVHGRAAKTRADPEDTECIAKGLALCAGALRKIVDWGERPSLSDLELLGGPNLSQSRAGDPT